MTPLCECCEELPATNKLERWSGSATGPTTSRLASPPARDSEPAFTFLCSFCVARLRTTPFKTWAEAQERIAGWKRARQIVLAAFPVD